MRLRRSEHRRRAVDEPLPRDGRRRVVIVAGPSGAGKSRLAAHLQNRHGWPIVRLDDFYRDGDDPSLPILPMGVPDWDNPRSWDADAAVQAPVSYTHLRAHET